MKKTELRVGGLHCPSCSMLVEMTLEEIGGVVSADCEQATGATVVEYEEQAVDVGRLVEAIRSIGYTAEAARG